MLRGPSHVGTRQGLRTQSSNPACVFASCKNSIGLIRARRANVVPHGVESSSNGEFQCQRGYRLWTHCGVLIQRCVSILFSTPSATSGCRGLVFHDWTWELPTASSQYVSTVSVNFDPLRCDVTYFGIQHSLIVFGASHCQVGSRGFSKPVPDC